MKEVVKALGRPVDFTVANDYRTVSEALDQGLSIAAVRRRCKALKSITKISNALAAAGQRSEGRDRTSVVSGKSVSVRVDLGGSRIIKKKKHNKQNHVRKGDA